MRFMSSMPSECPSIVTSVVLRVQLIHSRHIIFSTMSSGDQNVKVNAAQKVSHEKGLASGDEDLTQAIVLRPQQSKPADRNKATRGDVMELFRKLDKADQAQAAEEEMSVLTKKLDGLTAHRRKQHCLQ